jgi:hypothetical protein
MFFKALIQHDHQAEQALLATHKHELDSIKSKLLQQHIENERLKKELATSNTALSEAKQAHQLPIMSSQQPSSLPSSQQSVSDSPLSSQPEQNTRTQAINQRPLASTTPSTPAQGTGNISLKRTTLIQQQFQQDTASTSTPSQTFQSEQTEDQQQQQQNPAAAQSMSKRTREEDK